MKKQILCGLLVLTSLTSYAGDQVAEELRYNEFLSAISSGSNKSLVVIEPNDSKLMVDALWDAQENGMLPMRLRSALRNMVEANFEISDRLRLAVLRKRVGMRFDRRELGTAVLMGLSDSEKGGPLAALIVSLRSDLGRMGLTHIVTSAKIMQPTFSTQSLESEVALTVDQTQIAKDVWDHTPDLSAWQNGEYEKGIRLYMFCRSDRKWPCVQIARNIRHEPLRLDNGDLWSQPALAKSARDLPSNQRNGHTPTGIHTIDGVMPAADQVLSFGKFRRLILDFVPRSTNEQRQRDLLPESSQGSNWWRPNVVARDIGRSLFRIHGSGRMNDEPNSEWFPFRPTSGCIAKRENTYNEVEYRDQRNLLDTLMAAMDLTVEYKNETAIKGILFLIEIDDAAAPVTLDTLKAIGIQ